MIGQAEIRADDAHILFDNARNQSAESWRRLMAVAGVPMMQMTPLAGELDADLPSFNWEDCHTLVLGGNPELLAQEKLRKNGVDIAEIAPDSNEWKEVLQEAEETCAEGKKKVLEQGGLHIIGTERHDSRRIDNQLRGRAGRQGHRRRGGDHVPPVRADLVVILAPDDCLLAGNRRRRVANHVA